MLGDEDEEAPVPVEEELTALVDTLLDVSRLDRGVMVMNPEWFDLGECVRELVEQFLAQAAAAGSRVELSA